MGQTGPVGRSFNRLFGVRSHSQCRFSDSAATKLLQAVLESKSCVGVRQLLVPRDVFCDLPFRTRQLGYPTGIVKLGFFNVAM